MKMIDRLLGAPSRTQERSLLPALSDLAYTYTFAGQTYFSNPSFSYEPNRVTAPDATFGAFVEQVHRTHGVISAAVEARALLLSQLRFKWRSLTSADSRRLFGTRELDRLEYPNRWQTRAEFLKTLEYHASYSGNAYVVADGNELRILNPGWVSVVLGSNLSREDARFQSDLHVVEYVYQPGGSPQYGDPEVFGVGQVAHWRPEPDPIMWWRGSSWVQSVLSEFVTDVSATTHTHAFFEHGATPQLVFTMDPAVTQSQVEQYADMLEQGHSGAANAYKNLVLGGGADVTVVGAELGRIDLKNVQGLSETRIALRSRVPAVVLGISEGMQGSSLNAGNYGQARRLLSDAWYSPTAEALCATLGTILDTPAASELSYDPAAVMFLQDDRLDEAEIQFKRSQTARNLLDSGYTPESVSMAVITGDFSHLKHSGLFSVQLQKPDAGKPALPPPEQP